MKQTLFFIISIFILSVFALTPYKLDTTFASNTTTAKLAIVIDDFGSYEQDGVDLLLTADCPLTCAVIPFVDNTLINIEQIKQFGHEIILHMPMQSHVNLPKDWYGPIYISLYDTPDIVNNKLATCLQEINDINGFNIHIGSGVSRNKDLMKEIYKFAKKHNLYFLDSRTIETTAVENACKETNSIYLGRDVFLEADKNRSYNGVKYRLQEAANIAKENGYAIAIGHIGAEGGINTAKAILDSIDDIKKQGIQIVPLNEIYKDLKSSQNTL